MTYYYNLQGRPRAQEDLRSQAEGGGSQVARSARCEQAAGISVRVAQAPTGAEYRSSQASVCLELRRRARKYGVGIEGMGSAG